MASAVATVRPASRADSGYRRVLVPISGTSEWERALEIACALAADRGAVLTVVFVIEVSPLLPLDARMDVEEATARDALLEAEAISDAFAIRAHLRTVRAREAGRAIVELAEETGAEVIVVSAPRKQRAYGRRSGFGATVRHVLAKAPCRVLVVAPPMG